MTNPTTIPRISNGPQILCWCGAVSNHITGLCATHREPYLTSSDRAYLEWKRAKSCAEPGDTIGGEPL